VSVFVNSVCSYPISVLVNSACPYFVADVLACYERHHYYAGNDDDDVALLTMSLRVACPGQEMTISFVVQQVLSHTTTIPFVLQQVLSHTTTIQENRNLGYIAIDYLINLAM
jgi:hypothetical protein